MEEVWKDIIEYIGLYMVSSYGRIKSLTRKWRPREKILKSSKDGSGHSCVCLYKNNVCEKIRIHRLVLEAFVGSCPVGKEGCHNDGNGENNFVKNLRWDTRYGNMQDKKKHGTEPSHEGFKNPNVKLNSWIIRIIKQLLKQKNLFQKEIAQIFDISVPTVSNISRGISWR